MYLSIFIDCCIRHIWFYDVLWNGPSTLQVAFCVSSDSTAVLVPLGGVEQQLGRRWRRARIEQVLTIRPAAQSSWHEMRVSRPWRHVLEYLSYTWFQLQSLICCWCSSANQLRSVHILNSQSHASFIVYNDLVLFGFNCSHAHAFYRCDCLQLLVNELHKHKVISETAVERVMLRR